MVISTQVRISLTGFSLVAFTFLSAGAEPIMAANSSMCGGLARFYHNACGAQTMNFHICYGRNGQFGGGNIVIANGGAEQQTHVQQFSTANIACGNPAAVTCPGTNNIDLVRCD
jgi:hypothetical protein